uniref:Sulfotransferase domain-containing protein n=1 Tax=Lotharella globosa TaxID=91324 RepID=A0A7S4DQ21_9EUKA|mmetsp:Transcript_23223/g.45298  ORF Transcript_23223/g.45298 Transcript_23223/m.45298 type:complete len:381 (+) Transcript_23223:113-1255(+)
MKSLVKVSAFVLFFILAAVVHLREGEMEDGLFYDGAAPSPAVARHPGSTNVSDHCLGVLRRHGLSPPNARPDETPKKKRQQFFYVEHVMKCGGTALCWALTSLGGCSHYHRDIKRNCRMDSYGEPYRKGTDGFEWDSANITSSAVQQGMATVPSLCGVVFNEPGWMHRHENTFGEMERYRDMDAPFWDAYTTILIVRDPWPRYYSHVRMLKLFQEQDDSEMSSVDDLVRNQGPFDDDEMRVASTNFLTQHLVPEFRQDPSNCTQEVLRRAMAAVDRFDHVFNFFGHAHEESEYVLQSLLGVWIDDFKTRRVSHRRAPLLTDDQKRIFDAKNQCDLAVIDYVNEVLRAKVGCLDHVFPFERRQRHSQYCGVYAGHSLDMRC